MPETSGGPVNGKYVEKKHSDQTGSKYADEVRERTGTPPSIREAKPLPTERIGAPELYSYYSREAESFKIDAPAALISRIAAESLERLRKTLLQTNELQRENYLALGISSFQRLAAFVGTAPAFDDALSMVLIATAAHRSIPYSRQDIRALEKVFEMLKRNPIPSEGELELMHETLDAAGFDLNAPMNTVDFEEESGES